MASGIVLRGGCMCGKVRYTGTSFPDYASNCCCVQCRKAAGAPFQTFATFPKGSITWVNGPPEYYRHSDIANRGFCASCGSSISFERNGPDVTYLSIAAGTIDDWEIKDGAEKLPKPRHYIYVKEKPVWFTPNDGLPQYEVSSE